MHEWDHKFDSNIAMLIIWPQLGNFPHIFHIFPTHFPNTCHRFHIIFKHDTTYARENNVPHTFSNNVPRTFSKHMSQFPHIFHTFPTDAHKNIKICVLLLLLLTLQFQRQWGDNTSPRCLCNCRDIVFKYRIPSEPDSAGYCSQQQGTRERWGSEDLHHWPIWLFRVLFRCSARRPSPARRPPAVRPPAWAPWLHGPMSPMGPHGTVNWAPQGP